MAKGPLKTTRRIFQLAAEMGLHAALSRNFVQLCAMKAEFDDLCSRYSGPSSDMDLFVGMANEAMQKGLSDLLDALVAKVVAAGTNPVAE